MHILYYRRIQIVHRTYANYVCPFIVNAFFAFSFSFFVCTLGVRSLFFPFLLLFIIIGCRSLLPFVVVVFPFVHAICRSRYDCQLRVNALVWCSAVKQNVLDTIIEKVFPLSFVHCNLVCNCGSSVARCLRTF